MYRGVATVALAVMNDPFKPCAVLPVASAIYKSKPTPVRTAYIASFSIVSGNSETTL
jgi:hypothetical protein